MQLSVSWAVTQKEVRADYPNWEPLGGDVPANERFYNVRWTDDIAPANVVEVTPCVFLTRRRTFTNRSVLPPPGGKKIFINKVMEVKRYKGKPPVVKMHQLDDDDFDANIRDHLEKLMNMPESAAANAAARAGAPEEEKASKDEKKPPRTPTPTRTPPTSRPRTIQTTTSPYIRREERKGERRQTPPNPPTTTRRRRRRRRTSRRWADSPFEKRRWLRNSTRRERALPPRPCPSALPLGPRRLRSGRRSRTRSRSARGWTWRRRGR